MWVPPLLLLSVVASVAVVVDEGVVLVGVLSAMRSAASVVATATNAQQAPHSPCKNIMYVVIK